MYLLRYNYSYSLLSLLTSPSPQGGHMTQFWPIRFHPWEESGSLFLLGSLTRGVPAWSCLWLCLLQVAEQAWLHPATQVKSLELHLCLSGGSTLVHVGLYRSHAHLWTNHSDWVWLARRIHLSILKPGVVRELLRVIPQGKIRALFPKKGNGSW